MQKKTVRDIDVAGKAVLLRVDYNVPIKNGEVGDTLRLTASFETINFLLEQKCRIVLISHLGRPEGKPNPVYSLGPVAKKASELLGHPIKFVPECVGNEAVLAAQSLLPGEIILLENLRFHPEEEANDDTFARALSQMGEVFVDDAFAAIHRAHASTVGVTKYLPSVSGLLVEKEVNHILGALTSPERPLMAIIGGAKVSTKIEVLENLLSKTNVLVIGGAMANTFLAAQGLPVGKSLYEPELVETANGIINSARMKTVKVILPQTVVVSKSLQEPLDMRTLPVSDVEAGDFIVDIDPAEVESAILATEPQTVIWNGPLGVTEVEAFSGSSRTIADTLIRKNITTVIGGGDTAAFVDEAGLHDKFSWVSTGGGASLELMSGKELPGIAALQDK